METKSNLQSNASNSNIEANSAENSQIKPQPKLAVAGSSRTPMITGTVEEKNNYLDFEIAQLKFKLTLPEFMNDEKNSRKLLRYIIENQMFTYYEIVCSHLKWEIDEKILNEMKAKNQEILENLQNEINYAESNLGTIDIKEAYLNKANYFCKIGDKNQALEMLTIAYGHTTTVGHKLDNLLQCIKIGLFFNDLKLIEHNLLKCEELIDASGADWYYRNCYRIYKGLYALAIRDFQTACDVFTKCTSTFVCTDLISFNVFIKYTVMAAILALNRPDLKQAIMENGDVLQALKNQHQKKKKPSFKRYLFSFYHSDFKQFFKHLADIEIELRHDMLLHSHYRYYVREMRVKAYDQLLTSYRSVKLSYMAERFGVGEEFLENDLYKFIAAKRLKYKIDKIAGKIENNHENKQQEMFDKFIKQGDVLLNRIQNLTRVIDI